MEHYYNRNPPYTIYIVYGGFLNVILNQSNYRYNGDSYEMLIRIIHYFSYRTINIIMKHCYNRNPPYTIYIYMCVCVCVCVCVCGGAMNFCLIIFKKSA